MLPMSEFVKFPPEPPENHEALYLAGFRLDPTQVAPQLFTVLALYGENDRPIMLGERILMFADPSAGPAALKLSDNGVKDIGQVSTETGFMVDVAEALHILNALDEDEDGTILQVISCFDDLIRAAKINVPAQYMGVLSSISERLSENDEFASWLTEQGVDRETIEDAIMWCVGAVAVKTTVVIGE
jgi:hypothetical protein